MSDLIEGGIVAWIESLPTDKEIRDKIIDECAEVARREAGLLLFTGARLKSFEQATKLFYSEAELHDQAGTAIQAVVDKILALKDIPGAGQASRDP